MIYERFRKHVQFILIILSLTFLTNTLHSAPIFRRDVNVISTVNATIVPLALSGVFTGQGEEVSRYSTVTVFVDTDVAGTMTLEISLDKVNWVILRTVTIKANSDAELPHGIPVLARFFRLVYTNSNEGNQTFFRLQTIFHTFKTPLTSVSPNQVVTNSSDSILSRVVSDINLDIARGLDSDKISIHKLAFNTVVPNGTFADIWGYGPTDPTYNWPITFEKFRIKAGGNAADDVAGAGARTVEFTFLDANGDEVKETISTAGASASASTSVTGGRFLMAEVITAGTILSNNTGEILIENETSGFIVGQIVAANGICRMTHYTIPKGYTGYMTRLNNGIAVGTNKDADVRLWKRTNAYTFTAPFGVKSILHQWTEIQGNGHNLSLNSYIKFDALTDLWFEAKGNGAATSVDVDYDLILVKN